ncbi:endonuclease/exonuclease/phosphatase family protein [candidate division KSB1 bacterium]|nr:endonuclease/exonuclease/phosphatase family protein [candidate division KSB1 bacterium]
MVTYNMQGMRPGSNWQVRLFFMIQFFEQLDPDIICLQEINQTLGGNGEDNMARTVAEALSAHFGIEYHYYFTQTHIGWEQFAEGVGFVTKYPVLEEGARSLPRGDFPRKVAWNRVDTPLGIVNAFSTHLSGDAAFQQVQGVMAYISEIEQIYSSVGALLAGDFNSVPGSAAILLLVESATDTVFFDSFAEMNPGQSGFTIPAETPTSRIDYIFQRSPGLLLADSSRIVMDSTYDGSHFTSDHLGVMTVFSLAGQGTVPDASSAAPVRLELHSVYPNPFNSQATIDYVLDHTAYVWLAIYDTQGRLVSAIVEETQAPGRHLAYWMPRAAASGIYLIRLNASGISHWQKAVYIK